MSEKNMYEAVLVFTAKNGDDGANLLLEKFKALIEANGTIEKIDDWKKRHLAYEINDEAEGYYYLINFSAESEFPAELDRVLKITDGVLRSLIIRKE